jgi:hypothetical protein
VTVLAEPALAPMMNPGRRPLERLVEPVLWLGPGG